MLHAGSLYGDRNIGSFLRGFQLLLESGRIGSSDIRTVLLGSATEQVKAEARSSTPFLFDRGIVTFEPTVDWQKAQQLIKSADVLLNLLGGHSYAWTSTVPAKFYEYLATGKPILTVVQEGALRDICLQTNCGPVVDPSASPEPMARAIEEVLNRKPRSVEEIARVAAPYNFKNLTAKLAEQLNRVLEAGVSCPAPPERQEPTSHSPH
jgi:glycosyltransferase involved in cell wall biosynthesis